MTLFPRRVPVEILHSGFGFSEGPAALGDGSLAFCDGTNGTILRLADGAIVEIADVGGAPNGLALGNEQTLYVALMEPWRADQRAARPSIVRVDGTGAIATIATEAQKQSLVAPNDLAFSPEGRLYFTDSGDVDYRCPTRPSRIYAFTDEGVECVRELGPRYANGIAFDTDARLVGPNQPAGAYAGSTGMWCTSLQRFREGTSRTDSRSHATAGCSSPR